MFVFASTAFSHIPHNWMDLDNNLNHNFIPLYKYMNYNLHYAANKFCIEQLLSFI